MATVPITQINLNYEVTRPVQVQYISGNMFSMDNGGNAVHVFAHYEGVPVDIAGTVSANVMRSDGTTVAVSGAIVGNEAYVIFPQAAYAVPGIVQVVIKLTQESTIVTIAAFVANVYRSSTDTIVDPGTIIPSVENLISDLETAMNSFPADLTALLAAVAPTYSSSSVYPTIGTIVWYDGVLKRNTVSITSAETFNPDHWENVATANVVNSNSSQIAQLRDCTAGITQTTPLTFELGQYHSTPAVGSAVTKSTSLSYATAKISVTEGDEITLNCTSGTGTGYRLYVWIDADGNAMNTASVSLSGVRTIVAPPGAVAVAINNRLTSQPDGYWAYKGHSVAAKVNETTELVTGGGFTQGIEDYSIGGLTRTTNGDTLTLYGTSEYTRRYLCFNGQNSIRTTTQAFAKTLDPGTYYFEFSRTGSATGRITISGTYATFANAFNIVADGLTKRIMTFENPVMMGVLYYENEEYGTEEDPTTITVTIKQLSAIDLAARDASTANAADIARIDANKDYNSIDLLKPVGDYKSTTTSSGFVFTYDPETKAFHVVGTADSVTYNVIFSNTTGLIPGVSAGNDYFVTCNSTDPTNVYVEVWLYFNNSTSNPVNNKFDKDGVLSLPSNTTGMIFRIRAKSGSTVDAYISNITFKNARTNRELTFALQDQTDAEPIVDYSADFTTGAYIATNGATADISSPVSGSSYGYNVIPCAAGDVFRIAGYSTGNGRLWAVIKADGTVLANAAEATGTHGNKPLIPVDVVIPENGAYLIVNAYYPTSFGYTPIVVKLSKAAAVNKIAETTGQIPLMSPAWQRNVIATYERYIVRNESGVLYRSADCGKTWTAGLDVSAVGTIRYAHIFANGCVAFFTQTKAYYSEDMSSYAESTVYEKDGTTAFTPVSGVDNFFCTYEDATRRVVSGQDWHVFGNSTYNQSARKIVWASVDNGHTYKIIYEYGATGAYVTGQILCVINTGGGIDFLVFSKSSGMTTSNCNILKLQFLYDEWLAHNEAGNVAEYTWNCATYFGTYIYYSNGSAIKRYKTRDFNDLTKHETIFENAETGVGAFYIGKRGDMIVETGGSQINGVGSSASTRALYYSTDQKTFARVFVDPVIADGEAYFLSSCAITADGHIYCGAYDPDGSGYATWNRLPAARLDDFVRRAGYNSVLKPL